jgi:hypothetical protein
MRKQPQLAIYRWIVTRYPSWLTMARPDHRKMMLVLLARIICAEASDL